MRSSDSQYAAAGPDPPWPPLLKGGKLGATNAEGNSRSSDREFSTAHPGPPYLPNICLNACHVLARMRKTSDLASFAKSVSCRLGARGQT